MGRAFPADEPGPNPATILLVEDEVLQRVLVGDELRQHGYNVVEAANADEALSILRSNVRVDVLLTDIHMPGTMDGVGLASHVRIEYPFVKVLMASSRMPSSAVGEAADGFFPKPYDFPRLLGHIKALVA
jgi:CheY-like chemotaxis protein